MRASTRDYPPALYAQVHDGQARDVELYRQICEGASTVLELGCGWGRVAIPISRDGRTVVGLDLSKELLELGRTRSPEVFCGAASPAKAKPQRQDSQSPKATRIGGSRGSKRLDGTVSWVCGDMRDFDLGRTFDRIIIPFNGIYCLLDEESVIATLRRVAAHLDDDGIFAFDGYGADAFHSLPEEPELDEETFVKTIDALGTKWDVYERSRWDRARRRIDAMYRHRPRDGRPEVTSTIPQRYLLRAELPRLLAEAGLVAIDIAGDFDGAPADDDSPQLIVRARKAPTA